MTLQSDDPQPTPDRNVELEQQLELAVNLLALNWPVLTPKQKARVLSAIPREEWPNVN